MKKINKLKFVLIIISIIITYSCDPVWSGYEKVYITNETNNSFKVLLQFVEPERKDTLLYLQKKVNNQLVSDYYDGGGIIGRPGIRLMKIWIYNETDSTFFLVHNENNLIDEMYGPKFNVSTKNINVFTDIDNKNRICKFEVFLIIDDSLESIMSKDIQMTDSIFGLKKQTN